MSDLPVLCFDEFIDGSNTTGIQVKTTVPIDENSLIIDGEIVHKKMLSITRNSNNEITHATYTFFKHPNISDEIFKTHLLECLRNFYSFIILN